MDDCYDLIVIGAGAAGLFCAAQVGQRGKRVLVLEKSERPGLKILISGGGRCNFTNLHVSATDYISNNPHFCKSALARFQPRDFIKLVEKYEISYHEKHGGQLFCDASSKNILNMLLAECRIGEVDILCDTQVLDVVNESGGFRISTSQKEYRAKNLVVATGGLSYSHLGATDFGYRLAEKFGHQIVKTTPALTPLLWSGSDLEKWRKLAGMSCRVKVSTGKKHVEDDLLFTHTGLSGPAILRISAHWNFGQKLQIDFFPHEDLHDILYSAKLQGSRVLLKNILAPRIPHRLAEFFCEERALKKSLAEVSDGDIKKFAESLKRYVIKPEALAGFEKAEVTLGGVDTSGLSSKTLESKIVPGLFFIGEVVDVTGDLGGYNFQWAWSSASAAACAIAG